MPATNRHSENAQKRASAGMRRRSENMEWSESVKTTSNSAVDVIISACAEHASHPKVMQSTSTPAGPDERNVIPAL